jgi:hypothetical protein
MSVLRFVFVAGLLLGCSDDERIGNTPSTAGTAGAASSGAAGSGGTGSGGAAGTSEAGGAGGAGAGGTGAGGAAGAAASGGVGGAAGATDPGGPCSSCAGLGGGADRIAPPPAGDAGPTPVEVTLDPCTLEFFDLPIDSVRTAVSGFDPEARICASIIWDFSNNDLERERFCGEFVVLDNDGFPLRSGFPYVVLRRDQDAPCSDLWQYADADATAASGCIDPNENTVDAIVDVEVEDVRYLIRARSLAANQKP